jgi:hypothetical protein
MCIPTALRSSGPCRSSASTIRAGPAFARRCRGDHVRGKYFEYMRQRAMIARCFAQPPRTDGWLPVDQLQAWAGQVSRGITYT